jgi:hypothetical protein
MRRLKSSFVEFRRIFEQSITVRNIAEPLASFEQGFSAGRAREVMGHSGYDVAGVSRDGAIDRYVLRAALEIHNVRISLDSRLHLRQCSSITGQVQR